MQRNVSRRITACSTLSSSGARFCSTSTSGATTPRSDDMFRIIFKINTVEEFKRGAAQAYTAVGNLLEVSPALWQAKFGVSTTERGEYMTDTMWDLCYPSQGSLPTGRNLAQLSHPSEAVLDMRILGVSAEPRVKTPAAVAASTATGTASDAGSSATSTPQTPSAAPSRNSVINGDLSQDCSGKPLPDDLKMMLATSLKVDDATSMRVRLNQATAFAEKYKVECVVEMIVASPPERFHDAQQLRFFMARAADAETVAEKKNLARFLLISNGYGFFSKADWLVQKLTKGKLSVFMDSVPLAMFRLPTNFFTMTPTVRKVVHFELTPQLNWAVSLVTVDPSYLPLMMDDAKDDEDGNSR
jgi:hypothetical protein